MKIAYRPETIQEGKEAGRQEVKCIGVERRATEGGRQVYGGE